MTPLRKACIAVSLVLPMTLSGCTGDDGPAAAPTTAGTAVAEANDLPGVIARVEPSVVTVLVGEGLGSGVVFRDGGLILINEHVVGDARAVQLALADGSRVDADIIGTDAVTDLVVLRAERSDTTFGGAQVASVEAFLGELRGVDPGDRSQVTVVCGGQTQTMTVTVGAAER